MILYPEVQEKIRKEVDTVVGTDRLPEFEDEDSLPYLNAALKELMRYESVTIDPVPCLTKFLPRWRPVSNLGMLTFVHITRGSTKMSHRSAPPVHGG
jgi:Cytochrome P450